MTAFVLIADTEDVCGGVFKCMAVTQDGRRRRVWVQGAWLPAAVSVVTQGGGYVRHESLTVV